MRTDTLIEALVADGRRTRVAMAGRLGFALAFALPVSTVAMLATIDVRPDFLPALATWRFDLKLAITTVATLLAAVDCARRAVPLAARSRPAIAVALALLAGAVAFELAVQPPESWMGSLRGRNALLCLAAIPALSLAPLAALLFAMRGGAAASPTMAGIASGILAASAGATIYALHCVDDSPLFVATWYLLASLPVVALGALAGRFWLRW